MPLGKGDEVSLLAIVGDESKGGYRFRHDGSG
jgi:hypothetical protein